VPWVALDRIRAEDASATAIRFYRDHADEIDRVIKERSELDRESLLRDLVLLCYGNGDADADADVIALIRRLLQLNARRSELSLVLGVRLFHAGLITEAAEALERAEKDADALPASERSAKLGMLHLYRGAVKLLQKETESARRSFRKAMALEPRRLVAPLMAAELEGRSGNPRDRLLRRRALRLVDRVEERAANLAAQGELSGWLPDALSRRCGVLRKTLEGVTP
jgi:tetratricopeptide (TPR) repeat protein